MFCIIGSLSDVTNPFVFQRCQLVIQIVSDNVVISFLYSLQNDNLIIIRK